MNERIKEMVEQAQKHAREYVEDEVETQFHKKFAELIVRECVEICNNTNNAGYLNGVVAGEKIKEHFGVEA